ncbi:TPA: hypothetical protein JD367_04035 [Citrobacter freundii]|uniref:hypothetical protein n=1 Tax=Citrobacter freundii TaxID=546 RepID=UPI001A1CAAD0|nr:hypothetical protein [Citrobacter freundii]
MMHEAREFEVLVEEIFNATEYFDTVKKQEQYDLYLERNGNQYIVEIKYYRTMRAQTQLVNKAIGFLSKIKERKQDEIDDGVIAILAVSAYLELELKQTIEEDNDIVVIDLLDLISLTSHSPELRDRLVRFLEIPDNILINQRGRGIDDVLIRLQGGSISFGESIYCQPMECLSEGLVDNHSEHLINKLKTLPSGKDNWKEYEGLMITILQYLFEGDLNGWVSQCESENKLNRYDCVCSIKKNTDFWSFVVEQLKSNYILLEFKNYTDEIGQGAVLTTEKYLYENAFRKIALIFSRKGANASALEMCNGAMRENGRLILVLNDNDIIEMLLREDRGGDPSDYLFDKVDNFLMRLSR